MCGNRNMPASLHPSYCSFFKYGMQCPRCLLLGSLVWQSFQQGPSLYQRRRGNEARPAPWDAGVLLAQGCWESKCSSIPLNAVAFPEFGKIGGGKSLHCVNLFFSDHRSNKMVLVTHQRRHLPRASPLMCTPAARDLIVGVPSPSESLRGTSLQPVKRQAWRLGQFGAWKDWRWELLCKLMSG